MDKFALQDAQYEFPYHHLPHFDGDVPSSLRRMSWGLEYLCYQRALAELVAALAPRSLLDVGCGDGHFLSLLADVPSRHGIDMSESAIRFARAFLPDVELTIGDVGKLPGAFDVVTSIETLEHIPDDGVGAFLRALADRSNGHVLITVPTTNVPLNNKHYRHYDLALLEAQVKASRAPLKLLSHEFVYRASRAMQWLRRATANRLWTVEIAPLQRLAWQYVWKQLRYASATDGAHLIACYGRV